MALPICVSDVPKGLAKGDGWPMLSLRDLPLHLIESILAGRLIALRIELALRFRAWPEVIVLERDAAVGAAKLEERLALRVGGADADLICVWCGFVGEPLLKYDCWDVLMGEVGVGVLEAMVPPTPVLKIGETTLRFAVLGDVLGGTDGGGDMRAGLWGDPIAMTNGMFELDALLGRLDGGEAMALELTEPSRDRNCNGEGIADWMIGLLGPLLASSRGDSVILKPDEANTLPTADCRVDWPGESRIASANTFVLGGVCSRRGLPSLKSASKRPNRGRGGLSGMLLPFGGSGADPERSRVPMGIMPISAFEEKLD